MFTLRQYLFALTDLSSLSRTLGDAELCRDSQGRPLLSVGNSAAVFRVRYEGRVRSLRCYFRPMRRLRAIYGERLLERELFVHTSPDEGRWADVVLGDWIEGRTLCDEIHVATAACDRERLRGLAAGFDRLAAALVSDEWAHGDLKPENIIVDAAGGMHLIDFDAVFLPAFAGGRSPELGTAAYQHPARGAADFDARLDDYPAALISTALHALALDPSLAERYGAVDGLLFTPQRIDRDPALDEAIALFERRGEAAAYRIARLLRSASLRLPDLPRLLNWTVRVAGPADVPTRQPELFAGEGLWGYRLDGRTVVEPLYDCGFDFTEGLAAVRLGATWHFIDPAGRTRLSLPGCQAVKPFRDGRAVIVRDGRRLSLDPTGREFDI